MKYSRFNENEDTEKEESSKLNPFQLAYFIYTIIYLSFCFNRWERFGMVLDNETFLFLSAGALVFTIAVLVYNHKYEKRAACRIACYVIAALALLSCVVYLF